MAMANKVGHDQRGKSVFLRDSKGNDVLEIRKEEIKETKNGKILSPKSKICRDKF